MDPDGSRQRQLLSHLFRASLNPSPVGAGLI